MNPWKADSRGAKACRWATLVAIRGLRVTGRVVPKDGVYAWRVDADDRGTDGTAETLTEATDAAEDAALMIATAFARDRR